MPETLGRRERKKAQTRQAIADAALRLFLERGYDGVSVKDIADTADVSVTTLFKHFPGKEALVFDEDEDREAELLAAVRDRPSDKSIPEALLAHLAQAERAQTPDFDAFHHLVSGTPALREYAHRMWMRHQGALARTIAEEIGAGEDDVRCAALARFALESASLTQGRDDPQRALAEIFVFLEHGWDRHTS